ncbi:MAG: NHL repeat-containing protein [Myxococcaceae bacterium]
MADAGVPPDAGAPDAGCPASDGGPLVVVIGQMNPVGLSPAGVMGITFDGSPNPLVIDGFGRSVWRVSAQTAGVVDTFPLNAAEANTRSLAYDGFRYFTNRDGNLSSVALASGAVSHIGSSGWFNFSSLALHPGTGELWMVNDCANAPCTSGQGAQLWRVNKTTGAATFVRDFSSLGIGQATALAISASGTFYVATLSVPGFARIWALDPAMGTATFVLDAGLAKLELLLGLAFDSTQQLYAIDERRGGQQRTWALLRLDRACN